MQRSMTALILMVLVFISTEVVATPRLPKSVSDVLERADEAHDRLFPDFQFERFAAENVVQPIKNMVRSGKNRAEPLSPSSPSVTSKSSSQPYPQSVTWLLNMFEKGSGFPRSTNDVLPDGSSYWSSQTYIESGGMDLAGNHVHLDATSAIVERTLTRYGLNIRNGGMWEMALSIWGAHTVAYVYENEILYTATTGPDSSKRGGPGGILDIRCDSDMYVYGAAGVRGNVLADVAYPGNVTHFPVVDGEAGPPVKHGPGAYFLRFLAPHYKLNDPMSGNYGNDWKYPWPNYDSNTTWDTFGTIHFDDWVATTNENLWGIIIGPVQALGFATHNDLSNSTCGNYFHVPAVPCSWSSFDTTPPAVQLAASILPALLAMQTEHGALFETVGGSRSSVLNPYEGSSYVSTSTQLAALVAFTMMVDVLQNYTKNTDDERLLWMLESFTNLKNGVERFLNSPVILSQPGDLPNGWRVLISGGSLNTSGLFPDPLHSPGGLDVEVQLLGLSLLNLDAAYGPGFSYGVWEATKHIAGYMQGELLTGVGPVLQLPPLGHTIPPNELRASVTTFEAINMAQILSAYYAATNTTIAAQLLSDAQGMYNGVSSLWPEGLRFPDGSFVEANKRYVDPNRGWFVNPLSAIGPTSWSVLQAQNCDPLHWFCGSKPSLRPPVDAGEPKTAWRFLQKMLHP